jgi:hypothetical protein
MKIIFDLIGFVGDSDAQRMEVFHHSFSINENFVDVVSMINIDCKLGIYSFIINTML